jgi:hypothetical protein
MRVGFSFSRIVAELDVEISWDSIDESLICTKYKVGRVERRRGNQKAREGRRKEGESRATPQISMDQLS